MILAHGLYEESQNTQVAIEMALEIVAAGRRPCTTNTTGATGIGIHQPASSQPMSAPH